MSIFKQGYQKLGPFKNWASHILFLRKRGLIVYLAGAENEGYGPALWSLSKEHLS